ncbi:hypothetical protein MXE38_07205 [Anaerobiospirillum sp. NML120448]|uniref:hypothetical protein n=1 Tax=Anaerobiospirillum sp. NML120448 TaxID=2932816 RepID=UPI001FF13B72|nr:hypothetical protein [Anaerobiospirillum sp. NML120448]MCK0514635.1 hypothetical protein [Anaerobiospirillum sp. NML120448]
MAKSDSQNEKFIYYLKNFGPWQGSSNQQAENNAINSRTNNNVEPFNFDITAQKAYIEALNGFITKHESKVVFISGQAGDGKTHFLRKIFIDPDLLNQTSEIWEDHKRDTVFTVSSYGVTFTVVKDFSGIASDDTKLLDQVFVPIEEIIEQKNDSPHIVLIAANNGKILEHFAARAEAKANAKENSAINSALVNTLESFVLLGKGKDKLDNSRIVCFDMAKCMNKKLVCDVFKEVINRDDWQKCSECALHSDCPIFRNRNMLLNNEVFYERLGQMFELLIDDGAHFTMRNILLLVANTLLGRQASTIKERFYTCKKFKNAKSRSGDWKDKDVSPLDNIFGANFVLKDKITADTIIFKQLEPLAVGYSTTKLIDNFILFGHDDEILSLASKYQDLVNSPDNVFGYSKKLSELLEELHESELDILDKNDSDDELLSSHKEMQKLLLSLRRMLFFTMDSSKESKNLFDPFLMTAYKFSQEYFELKQLLSNENKQLKLNQTIMSILTGCNRVFTSLMVLSQQSSLVVTSNNRLNPTGFCVLYNERLYKINYHDEALDLVNCLKIVDGSLLDEQSGQLYLAYYGFKDDSQSELDALEKDAEEIQANFDRCWDDGNLEEAQIWRKKGKDVRAKLNALKQQNSNQGKLVSYVHLTPKMFNYLMSLTNGVMSISFSDECLKELLTFKSTLEDYLAKRRSSKDISIDEQLSAIEFCKIDYKGEIRDY